MYIHISRDKTSKTKLGGSNHEFPFKTQLRGSGNEFHDAGVKRAVPDPRRISNQLVAIIIFTIFFLSLALAAKPALAATGTITGSVVNIRGGPGTSYTKVGAITRGAQVEVIKKSGDWYQIRFAGNRTGWVAASLINVKATTSPTVNQSSRTPGVSGVQAVEVTGSVVNLRKGPGTTYPVVTKVLRGTRLTVVSAANGWYQVTTSSGTRGYITSSLVKAVAQAPSPQQPPAKTESPAVQTPANSGEQSAVVTGSVVNVRSGPGTSFARVTQVKKGEVVQVLQSSAGWHRVRTASGKEGWIAGSLLELKPAVQPESPATNTPQPPVTPTNPSRGGDREEPEIVVPQPSEPDKVVIGDLLDISEIVAGNIQVISIKNSVVASYEEQKGSSSYTLTLKGIRKGSMNSSILLNGKGANRMEVREVVTDSVPSTILTVNAFGNCIYGIVYSNEGKVIKLFIKTDLPAEHTGPVAVVLDAGHGGRDPGAIGPAGTYEKTINLPIVLELGRLLAQDNIKVIYTRSDDTYLTLPERSQIANTAGADLFVSIHCNGNSNPEKQGISTYYYAPASNPVLAAQEEQRRKLATCLQDSLLQELGRMDMGVRQGNFAVLRETTIPCALVETLFITNPAEEQLLIQPDIQNRAAAAIARGIKEYLRQTNRL